ncbi:putative retrotransposon hot spot protein (RHS) [Trypanosoma cruzi]|uniref:Putative retrotransposon hot spot protein (RHS) n=1 Tax=Trypanosoma cruzi TaxID=5693 RepID=A0A2V2WE70_TRYCR|nr:putative retrotransposon hot spot protein (RHS) [Trypanosoma cruzi]
MTPQQGICFHSGGVISVVLCIGNMNGECSKKGSVMVLLCCANCREFFIKHIICFFCFSVVWGITMMHRCCGVYDLGFLRVAAAPISPPTFVCLLSLCAHVLLSSVCGDGGATRVRTVASGMREQTLRAHHVVVVCSLQHCAGWLAPACRRCGGTCAFGFYRILCG